MMKAVAFVDLMCLLLQQIKCVPQRHGQHCVCDNVFIPVCGEYVSNLSGGYCI